MMHQDEIAFDRRFNRWFFVGTVVLAIAGLPYVYAALSILAYLLTHAAPHFGE